MKVSARPGTLMPRLPQGMGRACSFGPGAVDALVVLLPLDLVPFLLIFFFFFLTALIVASPIYLI